MEPSAPVADLFHETFSSNGRLRAQGDLRAHCTDDIRTVKIKQSFFQRMFGTGDLDIYTAGDSPEAVLMGLQDPHEIKSLLLPK